ncbi:AzlD domain-containing protein [Streptomyces sp. NBS 14/10]|uniref:AzlD domain-containing protein n=1 Tax=Streptomyces sp. NBS 14/10 TaxID=1945643 RepID=UPI000B7F2431|nr:AzlD domain-containing protein [Streptomyces sp. NBS 14/10]KAK1181349.1 AzlD domain-containing protein [Streptomyces sp. NBS 14/10]
MTLLTVLLLAVGTYGLRLSGPLLSDRIELGERARRLLSVSATVLLCALVATSSLTADHAFAGWARPAGVLVGGVLATRRAPFLATVLAAAATTGVLRWLGVD